VKLLLLSILWLLHLTAWGATHRAAGSLAEVLARARDGDTILLEGAAVFRGPLVIEKRLAIVGTNEPVIDARGSGTVLTIRADGVTVRGLTVRGSGDDLGQSDSGIMIMGREATIEDCRLENPGFGIYIRGVNDCRIAGNQVNGDASLPSSKRGNGIHLWKTKGNQIANNLVLDARDGIYLSYADQNVIQSNRVERSRFGIHSMYSHRNRLIENTLTDNAVGATLMFAREWVVERNRAVSNRRHGILLKQLETSRISLNLVSGQNRGFFVQQAVKNRFEENVIHQNGIGLYLSGGSEENVFVGNAFVSNTDQVWQPVDEVDKGRLGSNAFHERGSGNFWSDYTGADARGRGIGDTAYHETDVFGYLQDRYPEVRLFTLSPAVALLRKGEELMPLLDLTGVTDLFPLIRPAPRTKRLLQSLPQDQRRVAGGSR
jgi:nitrous oxidase accessory protein